MRDGELSPDGDPGSETRASSLDAFVIFKFRHRHGSRGAWRKIRGGYVRVNFRSQFSCAAIRSVAFDGSGHSGFSKARPGRADSRAPCPARIRRSMPRIDSGNRPGIDPSSRDVSRETSGRRGFRTRMAEKSMPWTPVPRLAPRELSRIASRIRNPKPLSFPKDGFDIFPVSESTRINRMRVSRVATGTRRESPAHDPLPGDSPEGRRSFPMPLA